MKAVVTTLLVTFGIAALSTLLLGPLKAGPAVSRPAVAPLDTDEAFRRQTAGDSCCSRLQNIPWLEPDDAYYVRDYLYGCDGSSNAQCAHDCCNAKTAQSCKACCDMKPALGLVAGANCKARCDRCFTCSFPPGPPTGQLQCPLGGCQLGKRCVQSGTGRNAYCECVLDHTVTDCPVANDRGKCNDGYNGGHEVIQLRRGARDVSGRFVDQKWRTNDYGVCGTDMVRNQFEDGRFGPAESTVRGSAYVTYACRRRCGSDGRPVCTLYVLSLIPSDSGKNVELVTSSYFKWVSTQQSARRILLTEDDDENDLYDVMAGLEPGEELELNARFLQSAYIAKAKSFITQNGYTGWQTSYQGPGFQCGVTYSNADVRSKVFSCDSPGKRQLLSTGRGKHLFSFVAPCPVCSP